MKNHLILFLVLIAGTQSPLLAQQEPQKRKTAEQRTELVTKKMTDELSLTKEQQVQVYDRILKREKLRDAGRLPDDSREQIVADINKMLTPDQQKKWEQMRKEAREKQKKQKQQGQGNSKGKQEPVDDLDPGD